MASTVDGFATHTCPECGRSWGAYPDATMPDTCYWCEARDRRSASESATEETPTNRERNSQMSTSTASQKAARNAVGHVVEKGQAGSKRKAEQAAAKVQANADKVAALNADKAESDRARDEVVTRFKGDTPAKKASAKKAPAKAPAKKAPAKNGAKTTRTKPKVGRNVGKPIDVSKKRTAWVDRMNAATKEGKELDAWWKAGGKGQPPATPNMIAQAADAAAGIKPPARTKGKGTPRATSDNKRLVEARDLKRQGKRAKGEVKTLDDKQLSAWITKELKADPTLTKGQALMIAFRLDKISISGKRFTAAFNDVTKALKKAS